MRSSVETSTLPFAGTVTFPATVSVQDSSESAFFERSTISNSGSGTAASSLPPVTGFVSQEMMSFIPPSVLNESTFTSISGARSSGFVPPLSR